MALPIAPQARDAAFKLFKLGEAEKRELLAALKSARPLASIVGFAGQLKTSIPLDDVIEFLRFVFSYYPLIDSAEEADDLAVSLTEDMRELWRSDNVQAPNVNLEKEFREFLGNVFAMEKTVGASAKGMWLMRQHERTFVKSEIFTDLRHVFLKEAPHELPEAGVIVHLLKIHYHQVNNESYRDLYVALDRDDLFQLREVIDRALDKQLSLAMLMGKTELIDLLPVEDFSHD